MVSANYNTMVRLGITHLLHSASLVPLLPASAYPFGQPGDLYWMCNRVYSSTGTDNCEIGLA